jgi:hypothetical protein
MKMKLLLLALALLTATVAYADDEADIRATIDHYFKGHATGDGSHILNAFHPSLHMLFVRDGKFMDRPRDEYVAGFTGKPAADEAQRKRSIESIDITGNAAMAKIKLDYPRAVLTDYFSLLKIDGKWQVVNKIFHSEPKPESPK